MRPLIVPPVSGANEVGVAPTFSVIIPTYQSGATVAAAVESVLSQTRPVQEVIVVDDGSSDMTSVALSPFGDKIVSSVQPHRGASAARNVGIRLATAEFVAFLDADDVYESDRIEAFAELAERRPDLDVLMTDAYLEVEGKIVGSLFDYTGFAVDNQSAAILAHSFISSPAVRRRVIAGIGGFDEGLRIAEDWDCWIRLLHSGVRAGAVDQPLVRYRIGGPSLSSDRPAALRARVDVLERASERNLSPAERQVLDRVLPGYVRSALLAEAEQALRQGSPDARRRALRLAMAQRVQFGTRVRAFAAALFPRQAARRIALIERRTGHSYIRRPMPAERASHRS